MQENTTPEPTVISEPSTVNTLTPSTVHNSQNSFLVVLLSILLFISMAIAGFFAYQTQSLNEELRIMNDESKQTAQKTIEPVATDGSEVSSEDESFDCKSAVLGLTMKLPNSTWKCQNHEDGQTVTAISKIFTMQISSLGRGNYCELPIRDPQSPRYDPTSPDEICKITQFYSENNILLKTYKSYGQTKEIFGQIANGPNISITYVDMANRDLTLIEKTELTKILDSVAIK